MVGPWNFFDHMGPASFPVGEGINVRPHPQINMAPSHTCSKARSCTGIRWAACRASVPARVMMGSAYGATSPVKVFAETVYVEAHLQAGQSIERQG